MARLSKSSRLEIEQGLRWYAIQTKPKQETGVERRLRGLNHEVFLPWMRCRKRVGTRYQWVLEPLFPGYVFSRLDIVLTGKTARYSPGVKDFVRFGPRIPEIREEVIRTLQEHCPGGVAKIRLRPFKPGETVTIREGPLSGLEAVFEKEMKGRERVAVLLELLGRQTRLVLSREMIGRV
jgi:transcriptional antiterminator RfaH